MQGSTPQHYTIADFLKWNDDKELILNPKFQRGPVWGAPARSYLIDSILRGYPVPKLLLRTNVDRDSRRTIRDVVDGQQRLRTIIDFAANKLTLGAKAGEWAGMKYSDLEDSEKDAFLAYKLTCEQLINATDEDVLEVFVRINSYAVPVNAAELRNARFDSPFTDLVKDTIKKIHPVWDLGVLSNRDRVRMIDQTLVAEIYGFSMDGVDEGDEGKLNNLFEKTAETPVEDLPDQELIVGVCLQAADLLKTLKGEPIVARPHFLIIAACLLYGRDALPPGRLHFDRVPPRESIARDFDAAVAGLTRLNTILDSDVADVSPADAALIEAKTSTQRMRSRQTRFEYFSKALSD
jgi:hypothetical protein